MLNRIESMDSGLEYQAKRAAQRAAHLESVVYRKRNALGCQQYTDHEFELMSGYPWILRFKCCVCEKMFRPNPLGFGSDLMDHLVEEAPNQK